MDPVLPKHCPGVGSDEAGKASPCAGCPNQKLCSSGEAQQAAQVERDTVLPLIRERLKQTKHVILVISGKGGTGKSTISTMLARALAHDPSNQVGLLDLDICGPSVPRMFGLEGQQVFKSAEGWIPVYAQDNLAVMSCGFLLDSLDDAIIWRGPKKNTMIKQFLSDVEWGPLDYLIIDTPPGTSDEHISVVNYLKQIELDSLEGAVMVTTPQEVSLMDVRKQIDFCQRTGIKILGVIENMGEFICPKCSRSSVIFPPTSGGATEMANANNLDILGQLPLDPLIGQICDAGESIFDQQNTPLSGFEDDTATIPGTSGDILKVQHSSNMVKLFLAVRGKLLEKILPPSSSEKKE